MEAGKSFPLLDSQLRVTGQVEYMINLKLPNMLIGRIVRSQSPHAVLKGVNCCAALQVPGVIAILTGSDLPKNAFYGAAFKDQGIVAVDRVRFIGEPVAAIAAETLSAADEAASLIEIEYEELPAVFDCAGAVQAGAPALHEKYPNNIFIHSKLRHGDLETGFSQADEIFEDTFTSPLAQQASLEPHVTAAQWNGEYLTIWSATQAPYMVQRVCAEIFSIPAESVRVIVPPIGGSYGGKGHIRIEPLTAAMAQKTGGRPVKFVLQRAEEFVTITKHAATITMKTGVKRDGTFTARQVTIHWNGGAYADASPLLIPQGMVRAIGPYRIPVVHVDSIGVYTNLPPAGAYRGAMSSQAAWAYESQMDIIAHKMGWDPLAFRQKNLFDSGDTFATGETLHDVHFLECLEKAAENLGKPGRQLPSLSKELISSSRFDNESSNLKFGRGYGVMMKSTISTSRSAARLNLDDHGVLTLYTSTVEMGQGAHTALAQIAADAIGVPFQSLRVIGPDTAITPFDSTTSASRSTSMMGNAIMLAGEKLRTRLISMAALLLEVPESDLKVSDGKVYSENYEISYPDLLHRNNVSEIVETGEYSTNLKLDPESGQGISTPHWHQGAGAVDVAVDTETGRVTVLRYSAASFAGKVVNPLLANLQNDGNVIFGLGPALMEEMILDGGQVINPNLADYAIPSIRDIPEVLRSVLVESDGQEYHGIGEMTLPPVAPAIANAVEDAVGVRIKDLPITAEKILRALQEKREQ